MPNACPFRIFAVIIAGLLPIGCGKAGSKPSVENILRPFEDKWSVVSLDRNGVKSTVEQLRSIAVTVEKDRFRMVEIKGRPRAGGGPSSMEVRAEEYALQVDPSKPTGEIDFAYASGEHLGKTRFGIFAFEGNKLTICLGEPGDARPTQFAPGGNITLIVLERIP